MRWRCKRGIDEIFAKHPFLGRRAQVIRETSAKDSRGVRGHSGPPAAGRIDISVARRIQDIHRANGLENAHLGLHCRRGGQCVSSLPRLPWGVVSARRRSTFARLPSATDAPLFMRFVSPQCFQRVDVRKSNMAARFRLTAALPLHHGPKEPQLLMYHRFGNFFWESIVPRLARARTKWPPVLGHCHWTKYFGTLLCRVWRMP